ncbi:MAG: ATP-binding protein [Hyphomicrobiales bacterium]
MKRCIPYPPKHILALIICAISLIVAIGLNYRYRNNNNISKIEKNFKKVLNEKELAISEICSDITSDLTKTNSEYLFNKYSNDFYKTGYEIIVYNKDSLVFWSDNKIPIPNRYERTTFKGKTQHFPNGYYYITTYERENYKIVGLILLKSDYQFKNEYLENIFPEDYIIPSNIAIIQEKGFGTPVSDIHGNYLFSIDKNTIPKLMPGQANTLAIFYIIALFALLIFLSSLFIKNIPLFQTRYLAFFTFLITIIIIRVILYWLNPNEVKDFSPLFSPNYYASSYWMSSLGDLIINTILIFISAQFFYHTQRPATSIKESGSIQRNTIITILGLLVALYEIWIFGIARGLIINSNIVLDLNNILVLNFYSLIAFLVITLLLISFFYIIIRVLLLIKEYSENKSYTYIILTLTPIVVFLVHSDEILSIVSFFNILILYLIFFLAQRKNPNPFSPSAFILYLLLISGSYTVILQNTLATKEHEQRELLSVRLSETSDPILEYSFSNIEKKIQTDSTLIKMLVKYDSGRLGEEKIIDYLNTTYFKGIWEQYSFFIWVCPEGEMINGDEEAVDCYQFFNDIISNYGNSTSSPHLIAIKEVVGHARYLGKFTFFKDSDTTPTTRIYIDIFSKLLRKRLGYPELLVDEGSNSFPKIKDYSYARYINNFLDNREGSYFYNLELNDVFKEVPSGSFIDYSGYSHYVEKENDNTILIVSKKNISFFNWFAPFSYMFLFFGIIAMIIIFLNNLSLFKDKKPMSFRNRLQFAMLGIILVSFLFVGISTSIYILGLNKQKNLEILQEKTRSVQIELEHKLANSNALRTSNRQYIQDQLSKFSEVFFIDINLYDTEGELIATSLPEVFNEGLISKQMNTTAFEHIVFQNDLLYTHNESIGRHSYYSAYINFTDSQGRIIAYLNLLYFARQGEIQKEISGFLVSYINIYVILIAITILMGIFVAKYITHPIELIRNKLRKISLNKTNEKIEWNQNDEIGALVNEYNRMIDELSDSASRLAKSERESAWRTMARQVAHEIKNPLTPMKLSIQYLQRAYNDNAPDWDQKLKRFSNNLVEQIDTLADIATAFSDFAKMPLGNPEKTNVGAAVAAAVEIFSEQPYIRINTDFDHEKVYGVYADPKQLIRIFNNIIKNAIQSIQPGNEGYIDVSIKQKGKYWLIAIKDNGKGIPKDARYKIFVPNFTTKTSGMGLGLAMVKNIVTNAKGDIWFDSEENEGTTFFIEFPIFDEE